MLTLCTRSESKVPGSRENSPVFRFFFSSFGKTYSFFIRIYPKGTEGKEDDLGVFLMNPNEVTQLKFHL